MGVRRYKVPLGMEGTVIIDGRQVNEVVVADDYDALRGVCERLARCLNGAMTRLERLEWKKSTHYSPSLDREAQQALASADAVLGKERT